MGQQSRQDSILLEMEEWNRNGKKTARKRVGEKMGFEIMRGEEMGAIRDTNSWSNGSDKYVKLKNAQSVRMTASIIIVFLHS
jgi:hypothetical protein